MRIGTCAIFFSTEAQHNGRHWQFFLQRQLRLQRFVVLFHRRVKQYHNPRHKENLLVTKAFKNIAPESGCF